MRARGGPPAGLPSVAVIYDFAEDRARWTPDPRLLFGWRGRDVRSAEDFFRRVHRGDVGRLRRVYRQIARPRQEVMRWTLPFRLRRRDGRYVEVVARAVGITTGSRGTRFVVATLHDVSAARRHDRALRRSEALYRSVVGSLHEGVVVLDPKGRVRDENLSARRLLDLPRGPREGSVWAQSRSRWFSEDGSPLPRKDRPATLALRTGEPQSKLMVGRRRDGSAVWLAATAAPLPPCEDGEPQGVVATFSDVTEAYDAARALRRLSLRLLGLRDEEQRKIARELHDGAAQSLTAASLNLAVAQRGQRRYPRPVSRALGRCRVLIEQASREVRTLSHLLHPPRLDGEGLLAEARGLCEAFEARSGIRVEIRAPAGIGRLPGEVTTHAYRILQEGLSNVLLHSRARRAVVALSRGRDGLRLEIRDDGRGIGKRLLEEVRRGTTQRGIGVVSMRERVRLLGGKFDVESGRWGTCVRALLPVPARA